MSRPCIFFDRDGIVNESPGPGYVERIEDFHLIPSFFEALRVAHQHGYAAAVVTNQRGVGLGRMTPAALDAIHVLLLAECRSRGTPLLAIYACTATDDRDPRRKPHPGMLLEAARDHDLDLAQSWMVGDNTTDVQAGQSAGCRTILVAPHAGETVADRVVAEMAQLPALLEKLLTTAGRA